jgi:hypothetical protein
MGIFRAKLPGLEVVDDTIDHGSRNNAQNHYCWMNVMD